MQPTQLVQFLVLATFFIVYITMLFYRLFPIEHLFPQILVIQLLLGLSILSYGLYVMFFILYKPIQKCIIFIKGVIKPH